MIKISHQTSVRELGLLKALPDFHQTTPGVPSPPALNPGSIQVYYRSRGGHCLGEKTTYLHDKHVLLLMLEGSCRVTVGDAGYDLRAGQVFLFPPRIPHAFPKVDGEFKILLVSFRLSEQDGGLMWAICQRVLPAMAIEMRHLFRCARLFLQWYQGDAVASRETAYQFGSFLNRLLHRYAPEVSEVMGQHFTPRAGQIVGKVFHVLNHDLRRRPQVQELAAQLNMSASNLRLIFRKEVKISLGVFDLRLRLRHAQMLLRSSIISIGEVAAAVGYQSTAAFIRVYKRETGWSPRQARINYQAQVGD